MKMSLTFIQKSLTAAKKKRKKRTHLKKNILVLENKDLDLSSGFYLL